MVSWTSSISSPSPLRLARNVSSQSATALPRSQTQTVRVPGFIFYARMCPYPMTLRTSGLPIMLVPTSQRGEIRHAKPPCRRPTIATSDLVSSCAQPPLAQPLPVLGLHLMFEAFCMDFLAVLLRTMMLSQSPTCSWILYLRGCSTMSTIMFVI